MFIYNSRQTRQYKTDHTRQDYTRPKMKDLEVRDPVPPTKRVHKLVLTGGPCGGKTTGQAHLATFFESLGWKVFRVPETATVLMSGGISFGELNEEQVTIKSTSIQITPHFP